MIISCNGLVTNSSWKYIPSNNSIVITTPQQAYMLQPAFINGIVFALQLDGVEKYSFLITEQNAQHFEPQTLTQLLDYFDTIEKQFLLEEKRKVALLHAEQLEKEKKKLHSEAENIVAEKRRGDFLFKLYLSDSAEIENMAGLLTSLSFLLITLILFICSMTGCSQDHEWYGWIGLGAGLFIMNIYRALSGNIVICNVNDILFPLSLFLNSLTLGPALYFGNLLGLSDWWSLITTPVVSFILELPILLVMRSKVKKYYSEIEQEFERLKKEKGLC